MGRSKCCGCFPLRKGAITIAVLDMILTAVILRRLGLALHHIRPHEIENDCGAKLIEDPEDPFNLFDDTMTTELPGNNSTEENNLYSIENCLWVQEGLQTQNRAIEIFTVVVSIFLVLYILHFLHCLLLLYGARQIVHRLLLPWLTTSMVSVVLMSLLAVFFLMVEAWYGDDRDLIVSAFQFAFVGIIEIYWWMVILSYKRHLVFQNLSPFNFVSKFNPAKIPNETIGNVNSAIVDV